MTPGSERGLVARRLQFTRHGLPNVVRRAGRLIGGQHRRLDSPVRHRLQDRGRDRAIDTQAADPDAQARSDVSVIAAALIAVRVARAHAVEHPHHAPALPAAHQAGQQRPPTAAALRAARFCICASPAT